MADLNRRANYAQCGFEHWSRASEPGVALALETRSKDDANLASRLPAPCSSWLSTSTAWHVL